MQDSPGVIILPSTLPVSASQAKFFVALASMPQSIHEDQVRRYYDRNTSVFLRFARAFQSKAIHQPLYRNPEMSLDEALQTSHELVADRIPKTKTPAVILDLGCGVGATLTYIAGRTDSNYTIVGLTLSGEQAAMARKVILKTEFGSRIQISTGSFQKIPQAIPTVDFAYAIEAFIHSPEPLVFFNQVAGKLKEGSELVIIDDFLSSDDNEEANRRILEDLRTGYMANTVLSPAHVASLAKASGLKMIASQDLTMMLKLNRWQDKLVRLSVPVARLFMRYSEYCRFLIGGDARQRALSNGTLSYRILIFRKDN